MDVNGQDIQFFPDEGPGSQWYLGPASGSVDVSIPVDGDLRINSTNPMTIYHLKSTPSTPVDQSLCPMFLQVTATKTVFPTQTS